MWPSCSIVMFWNVSKNCLISCKRNFLLLKWFPGVQHRSALSCSLVVAEPCRDVGMDSVWVTSQLSPPSCQILLTFQGQLGAYSAILLSLQRSMLMTFRELGHFSEYHVARRFLQLQQGKQVGWDERTAQSFRISLQQPKYWHLGWQE